jgi:hypothetical protein
VRLATNRNPFFISGGSSLIFSKKSFHLKSFPFQSLLRGMRMVIATDCSEENPFMLKSVAVIHCRTLVHHGTELGFKDFIMGSIDLFSGATKGPEPSLMMIITGLDEYRGREYRK